MRKLFGLLAAVGLLIGTAVPASSATLSLTGGVLGVAIGALPPITVAQSPGAIPILVSSGTGSFVEPGGIFATAQVLPTALFTGVPLISGLSLTASNATKVVTPPTAVGGILGQSVVAVLGGLVNLVVPLTVAGSGGSVMVTAFTLMVDVTGHIWTTGVATITGITTTTPGNAVVNTATLAGYDNRTAGHGGTIQLVTPIRILTNAAGNLPGFAIQTLNFIPEPGTLLLLGTGALGLGIVGRRRMKK